MFNVIIINTHDTGDFISPYGYKLPTPNLEEFSKESIIFENAFCASPTCSPSRACFMTGTYTNSNNMLGLAHRNFKLKNINQHLANVLQREGYETTLCGIQHENDFYMRENYMDLSRELGYINNISSDYHNLESSENQILWDEMNCTNLVGYLKKYNFDNKPLFLQYGMFSTHRKYPEVIGKEYNLMSKPYMYKNHRDDDVQGLYKSLESMDNNFGKVVSTLKEIGQWDKSIVIYTTDHGLANPYGKAFLTDNGTKVSFIMKVPKLKSGTYSNLFSQVDFCQTILDILDIQYEELYQGVSHAKYLINDESKKFNVYSIMNFHTSYEPARCIRDERYKLIKYYDENYCNYNYSNTDDSKYKDEYLKLPSKKDTIQFYDLYFDPLETNNLASDMSYKSKIKRYERLLEDKLDEINDSIPILSNHIGTNKINKESCVKSDSRNEEDYY